MVYRKVGETHSATWAGVVRPRGLSMLDSSMDRLGAVLSPSDIINIRDESPFYIRCSLRGAVAFILKMKQYPCVQAVRTSPDNNYNS